MERGRECHGSDRIGRVWPEMKYQISKRVGVAELSDLTGLTA